MEKEVELKAKKLIEIFGKELAIKCVEEILDNNPMIECGCSDAGTEYEENDSFWWDIKEFIISYEM
jgi:hypothetical protein